MRRFCLFLSAVQSFRSTVRSTSNLGSKTTLASLGVKANQKLVLMGLTSEKKEIVRETERALEQRRLEDEAREAARLAIERAEHQRLEAAAAERAARYEAERAERAEALRIETERRRRDRDDQQRSLSSTSAARLNESFDGSATVQCVLRAERPTTQNELDVGDKLLLPPSILVELTDHRVAFPFLFRISVDSTTNDSTTTTTTTTTAAARVTHARVVEFTAPDGVCVLSQRLLDALGAAPGAALRLATMRARDARKLSLRPHQAAWIDIDPDERRAALAFALRNYSTATVG